MKIKLILSSLILLFLFSNGYSQINSNNYESKGNVDSKFTLKTMSAPQISLGGAVGLSNIEQKSGISISLFSEIKTESFSFVPQANYWKNDDRNNFEVAGLVRLRFKGGSVEPYVDGGIGINFLTEKVNSDNATKVGLDLGGGVDFLVGVNYTIFIDAKYKIIVADPNIKGYSLMGGVKFYM
jgi:hypothetical protein